jgi:hypothetical protein
MADDSTTIELSRSELREVAGYAVACARSALAIFERERPDDSSVAGRSPSVRVGEGVRLGIAESPLRYAALPEETPDEGFRLRKKRSGPAPDRTPA